MSARRGLGFVLATVISSALFANYMAGNNDESANGTCAVIGQHTIQQDEFLSDVALEQIKAQKVAWPESISFNLLIQETAVAIQIASGLNTSTPSAGTVIQIPDLKDPDC